VKSSIIAWVRFEGLLEELVELHEEVSIVLSSMSIVRMAIVNTAEVVMPIVKHGHR